MFSPFCSESHGPRLLRPKLLFTQCLSAQHLLQEPTNQGTERETGKGHRSVCCWDLTELFGQLVLNLPQSVNCFFAATYHVPVLGWRLAVGTARQGYQTGTRKRGSRK